MKSHQNMYVNQHAVDVERDGRPHKNSAQSSVPTTTHKVLLQEHNLSQEGPELWLTLSQNITDILLHLLITQKQITSIATAYFTRVFKTVYNNC